jgi:hypothetical protein
MEANSCWSRGSERFARLKLIWADSGYDKGGFVAWVKETLSWEVQIVEHPMARSALRLGAKGCCH